ncbi:MAG TPA: 2-oxo acid dehydrogenase subunit E2, partial [Caulobacteraceae bacterium]|nr:2-oxo acid dehydrogenase subunit E2 [Caulobacteraceae bacterium]
MAEFRMPSLGADMEAGTLVEWLKKPGESVRRGDIIAVVETEKGAIEIEVFEAGVLDRCLVDEGVEVPVGTPLAIITQAGEATSAPSPAPAPSPRAPTLPPAPAAPRPAVHPAAAPVAGRVPASPAARQLAQVRGLDLARLSGSGPGGVIVRADVEAALAEVAAAPAAARSPGGFNLEQMRHAIAAAMSRSKREIPHYYLANTIDAAAAADWVTVQNAERPPERRLLIGALFVKAIALAAHAYPEFNGRFEAGVFTPSPQVHAGVAISIRGGGLIAPAIHDAADLSL